ncbi:putative Ig domain-containing protein, partial [Microcoleus sp. T3B2]|uniref:putative Ig domain-containing protein n=1 Tax=Microcoleus sp. T3B2 TaxID=3055426 RepID=UPI002FCF24A8
MFQSFASNLVTGDTNNGADIFLRDTQTNTTTRLSLDSAAAQGNSESTNPSISPDGRYVVFRSFASNLVTGDTNNNGDIFLRDTLTNTTTRLSLDSAAAQGNNGSGNPSISADGRYVVFSSDASNLVTGDTNNRADIFLRDTQTNTTTRLSLDSAAAEGNRDSFNPSISANGRYVVFESDSNLVTGDTNSSRDIFLRDRSPTITRVTSTTLDGLYGIGQTISITTEFDVPVTVVGKPQLQLETGTTDQYATYSSGTGGKTLTFNYIVQGGDESLDLESLTINALTLNGGTIQDIGGLNAILTLPTLGSALSLGGSKALVIDGIAPTVTINQGSSQADPTANTLINYTVQFSEPVTGFDKTKVTLSGTAGPTTTEVTGGGTTYNVAVSGMTQAGTAIASINANAVTDLAGNPNTASTSTDNQVTFTKNTAPVVATAITDKSVTVNTAFSYTVPTGTFTDAENDPLIYTATKEDGTALPTWLTFNAATGIFGGTPATADLG